MPVKFFIDTWSTFHPKTKLVAYLPLQKFSSSITCTINYTIKILQQSNIPSTLQHTTLYLYRHSLTTSFDTVIASFLLPLKTVHVDVECWWWNTFFFSCYNNFYTPNTHKNTLIADVQPTKTVCIYNNFVLLLLSGHS